MGIELQALGVAGIVEEPLGAPAAAADPALHREEVVIRPPVDRAR